MTLTLGRLLAQVRAASLEPLPSMRGIATHRTGETGLTLMLRGIQGTVDSQTHKKRIFRNGQLTSRVKADLPLPPAVQAFRPGQHQSAHCL